MKNPIVNTLSQDSIIAGFKKLGLEPTCHLMVHASLSRFGQVEGGANTVVAALRKTSGDQGAVIVPSFRDAIRSDHYALRECREQCPQSLCSSLENGYTGIIGETVRKQSNSLRSCHPTHSWVGIGKDARYLLDSHRNSPTPCGKDSPFFRLLERDGYVLLLGVGVNGLTNIHAVEDARNVPYLSAIDQPNRHATYTTSGRRIQYAYPELLDSALISSGIMKQTTIGQATCSLLPARLLASFLWIITEDDPWCLVLRPSKDQYEPEEDARHKTQQMIAAWKSNSDTNAWQELLAASGGSHKPVYFEPTEVPEKNCPAYQGVIRDYHRCVANDLPSWEKFEDFPRGEPGVATCQHCNWANHHSEIVS